MSIIKKQQSSPHSIRVPDNRWTAARARAAREGVRISHVVNEFLEGYARGAINLPRVVTTYEASPERDA